jgi:hypothetical protein
MTGNRKLVIGGEVIFTPKRRPPDVERWLIEGEPMSESERAFYRRFGDGPVAFSIGPRRSKAKDPERP